MAITITQINQGTNWVEIRIQGLLYNPEDINFYNHKFFEYYLDDFTTKYSDYEAYYATDYVEFQIQGLSANTQYRLKVVAFCKYELGTTTTWFPDPDSGDNIAYQDIRTATNPSPPTPSTGGKVHIYVNGVWRTATPYIYTNSGWRSATPYIYTNNGWRSCTT